MKKLIKTILGSIFISGAFIFASCSQVPFVAYASAEVTDDDAESENKDGRYIYSWGGSDYSESGYGESGATNTTSVLNP